MAFTGMEYLGTASFFFLHKKLGKLVHFKVPISWRDGDPAVGEAGMRNVGAISAICEGAILAVQGQ